MKSLIKTTVVLGLLILVGLTGCVVRLTDCEKNRKRPSFSDRMTWVKCRNSNCEAAYQVGLRDYFAAMEKEIEKNPNLMQMPALLCKKCGEKSVYRAARCEKCLLVFERGSMGANDFADRCPVCRYSKIEDLRKNAAARQKR